MHQPAMTTAEPASTMMHLWMPQIMDAISHGIVVAALDGTIQFANTEARRILGSGTVLIRDIIHDLLMNPEEEAREGQGAGDGSAAHQRHREGDREIANRNPGNGSRGLWTKDRDEFELASVPIRNGRGAVVGVVITLLEVRPSPQPTPGSMAYHATHDELTGLVNRRVFMDRLRRVAQHHNSGCHTLFFMDLDRFKPINDQCGHQAGDRALRQVAATLRTQVRQRDTLARLGGDEFGLLMENCELTQAHKVADALCLAMSSVKFVEAGKEFSLGISIGMVTVSSSLEPELLLAAADNACYRSKASGGSRATFCRRPTPSPRTA